MKVNMKVNMISSEENTYFPKKLNRLIDVLSSLPGIGKRSAERIAVSMLEWDREKQEYTADLIANLKEYIGKCPECGNYTEKNNKCRICSSANRNKSLICVVETPVQIRNIEKSSAFNGVYHVLEGKLSPVSGKSPDKLQIESLLKRIEKNQTEEIILALSPDMEGRATAMYISEILNDKKVKISMIAQGLPAGSDISYADSATISAAISGRRTI